MAWENIRKDKVDEGSFWLAQEGKTFHYEVIAKTHLPEVPFFVGHPDTEYLFISEQVPVKWRPSVLAHEIYCTRIRGKMTGCLCCLVASVAELRLVNVRELTEYAGMRTSMFVGLVLREERKDEPNREFLEMITQSLDFWRRFVNFPLTPRTA